MQFNMLTWRCYSSNELFFMKSDCGHVVDSKSERPYYAYTKSVLFFFHYVVPVTHSKLHKRETTFIRHCHSPMVAQMDSVHIYIIFIMRTFLFYNDNPGEYKWLFNIRIDDLIVCNMILSRSSNEKSNFFLKLSNSLKMVPLDPISPPIISIYYQ